jgi:2-polyprenyl-6-hydroxyphenyl methylase/3-demethylubiquinone-9 3-methyltransferase
MSTQTQTQPSYTSIDPDEVEQFSRIAAEWWDPRGKFKPLHQINPVRIGYIRDQVCAALGRDEKSVTPFEGLSLLDIGCGGGLIAEPMARLGAKVMGVDASEKNIKTAIVHALENEVPVDYAAMTAEALQEDGAQFDVVLALEIIEHVVDPEAFIASCAALVKPSGVLVMSTINRTPKSLLMAKFGAEYVLRMLPIGTHDWRKFVKPDEMAHGMTQSGLSVHAMHGMTLNPLRWEWGISPRDLKVNYLMVGRKG